MELFTVEGMQSLLRMPLAYLEVCLILPRILMDACMQADCVCFHLQIEAV